VSLLPITKKVSHPLTGKTTEQLSETILGSVADPWGAVWRPFDTNAPFFGASPWRLGGFGDFRKKTAVFGCLTNALAPPPIAL